MQKIAGNNEIKCRRCGCNVIEILEINHINCGGNKELKCGINLATAILNGTRRTDDLEILCKVCNILHYVEKKYKIFQHNVRWENNKNENSAVR